jgi:hypothetical protein
MTYPLDLMRGSPSDIKPYKTYSFSIDLETLTWVWRMESSGRLGMNLSKLWVSVNIAATMPLVVQGAAGAAEAAKVATSDWLKDSISSLDKPNTGVSSSKKPTSVSRAVARAKAKPQPVVLADGPTKILRPFVPHRPLPTRAELETALKAQEPKMAVEQSPTLNGGVSGFYQSNNENIYPSYSESTPAQKISPNTAIGLRQAKTQKERMADMTRNLIKSVPMLQQVTANAVAPRPTNMPISPIKDLSLATRDQSSVAPQQGFPMMQRAEHRLLDTYSDSSGEGSTTISASDMQMNAAQMANAGGSPDRLDSAGTASSAGPPPFPLNLLPEASLKKFIRGSMGGGGMARAPRVYFGSWHGTTMAHSLPPGGFHNYSYAGGGGFRTPTVHRYGTRTVAMAPVKHNNAPSSKRYAIAKQATTAYKPEPKVATYAPYAASAKFY